MNNKHTAEVDTTLPTGADRLIVDGFDASIICEEFLSLAREGGVHCIGTSMWSGYGSTIYGNVLRYVDQHSDELTVATTVREILQAKRDGKIALVFASQDANHYSSLLGKTFPATFAPLVDELRGHYELGLRTLAICYQVPNIFGGGCLDNTTPLSRAGRRLVEEIHKLNIVLDVGGHTGEQTSLDAIELSAGVPVVCTHTNASALNDNIRAISDRLAEAIAGTGGLIGLCAISDYHVRNRETAPIHGPISPQATLDMHLDQYDYFKRLVGVDHLALGPDFVSGQAIGNYNSDDSLVFPGYAMSNGPLVYVKDYENISQLPNLIEGLKGRGWTETELDKLLGGNWLRVYKDVWGE